MRYSPKAALGRYVQFVEDHAALALVFVLLSTVFAGFYTYNNFSINSSLDGLIQPSEDNQWYTDNEVYKRLFPQYQNTAVVVVSAVSAKKTMDYGDKVYMALKNSGHFSDVFAPVYDDFFQQRILYGASTEGVRHIAKRVFEHLPDIKAIHEQPSIERLLDFYTKHIQKDQELEALSETTGFYLTSLNQTLESIKLGSPQSLHFVQPLSPRDTDEYHYQLILVKSDQQFSEQLPNKAIIDSIEKAVNSVSLPKDVKVRVTGEVALANDEITAGMSGVELSGTLSLVLLFLILFLGIRYKRLISGIFLMLFVGIIWTMALGTFVVGAFNTLSLIFLVMFFGLAVDFAVHYSLRWLEAESSGHAISAGVETTRDIGSALFLCAITSSVAFLAFLPTAYKGLAELGIISAMGMLTALVLTLSFLPAWFAIFKNSRRLTPLTLGGYSQTLFTLKPRLVMIASLVFVCVGLWFAKKVTFDYSVLAMQNEKSEAMSTLLELQENNILTDYSISVILNKTDDKNAIINRLSDLPTVAKVIDTDDFIPKFQEIKRSYMVPVQEALSNIGEQQLMSGFMDKDAKRFVDPFVLFLSQNKHSFYDEDRVLLEQVENNLQSFTSNQEQANQLNRAVANGISDDVTTLKQWFSALPFRIDDIPLSVKERFITPDGATLISVLPSVAMTDRENMTNFIQQVSEVAPNIAGRSVVEWGVGESVKKAFIQATLIAIGLIFALLLIYFRSVKVSVLVLVPIIMTAIFIFCVIHFSGLTLNMANILVVPLIFGLGVDTGLHVIHRYENSDNMAMFAHSSTTRAVVISALTTIGTFVSLSFSPHKGAASIGILLSLSILFLLIATFIVLPALLRIFRNK